MINQESYLMVLASTAAFMVVFFFGIFYVMGYYYFSQDTNLLISLPIKPNNIVLSKFFTVLLYEYILLGIFLIPVFVVNSTLVGGGILYILKSIILFLTLPIAPLSIAAIFVTLLMKFTNIKGRKDLYRIVSMFAFLFVVLGLQIIIQRNMMSVEPGKEQEFISQMFMDNKFMLETAGRFYPLSKWFSLSYYNDSRILYLGLFVGATALIFALSLFISNKFYFKGLIGTEESTSKKKALNSKEYSAVLKSSPQFISIFLKDFKVLLRTPIYLFNCVSTVIIIPFIFIVMPLMTGTGDMMSPIIFIVMPLMTGTGDMMSPIIGLIEANLETALLIFAGAFMMFSLLNPTASTTFSREGKHFWIDRSLPINYSSHIIGRIISPMVLHLATILAITIGFNYFVKLDLIYLLIPFVVGFLGGIPLSLIGLIVDLKRPLLDWTNPQRAVKQNLNVLIGMVANLIFIAALVGLNYLFLKIDLNFTLIILLDIGLISLSSIFIYKYSIKYIGERLPSIN
jgi:ABC-2 type transport system permease protein